MLQIRSAFRNLMEKIAAVSRYVNDLMATHLTDVMWFMGTDPFKRLDERLAALWHRKLRKPGECSDGRTRNLAERLGSARAGDADASNISDGKPGEAPGEIG